MAFGRRIVILMSCAGALALADACSSKGSTNSPPPPVNTITKVSGDSQVGAANGSLGANLVVLVKDQSGAPVSGQTVTWTAVSGGGSVTSASSQTDVSGQATMGRTLGPAAGFQTTSASLTGAIGSPITFTSISQIQGAFTIALGAGTGQSDTVLSTLASPLQAVVTDHLGVPVAGVIVTFNITSGGGSLSQLADTTDVSGHATAALTFSATAGAKSVQASVTGLIGSPVTFSATATSGHPAAITLTQGNAQAAPVSSQLATALGVTLHDGHGNAASGVTVNWTFAGGGSLSASSTVSNASGVATVQRTVSASAGVGYDTATVAGAAGSPVAFTDTAVAVTDIALHDDFYVPQHDTVAVGSFARFTWTGAVEHTVTFDGAPGTIPGGSPLQQTGVFITRLKDLGKYSYHCQIHGSPGAGMFGDIVTQ